MGFFQSLNLFQKIIPLPVPFNPDPRQNPFSLTILPWNAVSTMTMTATAGQALHQLYASGAALSACQPMTPEAEANQYVARHQMDMERRIYNFEPETLRHLEKVNQQGAREIREVMKNLPPGPVRKILEAHAKKLEDNAFLYKSMYQPGGCIKKAFKGIGGFFMKAVSIVARVAPFVAPLIPGIGPIVAAGIVAVRTAYYATKGRWLDAMASASDFLGGVGTFAKGKWLATVLTAKKFVDQGLEIYQAAKQVWKGLAGWAGGFIWDRWGRSKVEINKI